MAAEEAQYWKQKKKERKEKKAAAKAKDEKGAALASRQAEEEEGTKASKTKAKEGHQTQETKREDSAPKQGRSQTTGEFDDMKERHRADVEERAVEREKLRQARRAKKLQQATGTP